MRRLLGLVALSLAVAMIVAALWAIDRGGVWAQRATRPDAAERSVALAALSLVAAAQVVLAYLAIPSFFRRSRGEAAYGLVGALAAVGLAIAAAAAASGAW